MYFLYNFTTHLVQGLLPFFALFNHKLRLFVLGRKTVFNTLKREITSSDRVIWFHAASLGEYEQGLPVMERIKKAYPNHKIVLSFFSPSGYEVRKNNAIADVTVYLPLDTLVNAKRWVQIVRPEMVFFIKYEYWPNYLNQLKKSKIQTFLISGIFRKNQAFFKWYGGFYRKALTTFSHFFVQNESSKELLSQLGIKKVTVSGDTRFDRVVAILERDNSLDFIEQFKDNITTIVIGSSWPKDEELLINYINQSSDKIKFIIAPHNIKGEQITSLYNRITKTKFKYSDYSLETLRKPNLKNYQVFIIDTIGILTKVYSYADIAYVGGGFGNPGVHNILEPATFGVPIIIGPNYAHFAEATALVQNEGCISIQNQSELNNTITTLLTQPILRAEKGHICETFVRMNIGATERIVQHIIKEKLN